MLVVKKEVNTPTLSTYATNIILKFQISIQISNHKDNLLVKNVFTSSIVKL